jgi:hypothetical protein
MKILRPITVTEPMLIFSSATETYSDWNSGVTYALNANVVYGTKIYRSLLASNTNHLPNAVGSTWWVEVGPSNQFAMFDEQVNTKTVNATTEFFATVSTGLIDSVFLANLSGDTVRIQVTDGFGGPLVYSEERNLSGELAEDWYEYFFSDPLVIKTQVLFSGIPPFGNAHVTVFVDGPTPSIGLCVFGRTSYIGATEYGASTGIIDYSRKETDDFGEVTFVRRNFSKRMDVKLWLPNSKHNFVQRLLYDIRARPVVWFATDDPLLEESAVVYGFYRDFTNEIAYPDVSYCSLQIEGLI